MTIHALLVRVHAAGGNLSLDNDELFVTAPTPLPDELVSELRGAKLDLLRHLWGRAVGVADPGPDATAQCWQAWYGERAAIREFDAHYTREEAERLAFAECVDRWDLIHGARPDPTYCAGCGNVVEGRKQMELPDGARVHVRRHALRHRGNHAAHLRL